MTSCIKNYLPVSARHHAPPLSVACSGAYRLGIGAGIVAGAVRCGAVFAAIAPYCAGYHRGYDRNRARPMAATAGSLGSHI